MKKILLSLFITICLLPFISNAENSANTDEYKLLEPLPCIEGVEKDGKACEKGSTISSIKFDDYISYIFKFAIAISVFLAIIILIWGGFEYMTSEIPSQKSDGKSRMKNAIGGLIMVLASYLILQTIDPRLVEVNTQLQRVGINTSDSEALFRELAYLQNPNNKVYLSNEKIRNSEETIKAHKKAFDNKEISEEEYRRRISPFLGDIAAEKYKIAQTNTSNIAYKEIDNVWNSAILDFNNGNKTAGKSIESTKIIYDKYIEELNKTQDYENIQKLKEERSFYVNQMLKSEEIAIEANSYYKCKDSKTLCGYTSFQSTIDKKKSAVQTRLLTLEKEYAEIDTVAKRDKMGAQITTQYKTITETRIQYLKMVLGK